MFSLFLILLSSFSYGDCVSPDGSLVPEGQTVYLSKTEFRPPGGECKILPFLCLPNGTMELDRQSRDGREIASFDDNDVENYKYQSCLNEFRCEDPRNPGEYILSGESIEVYRTAASPCEVETRTCDGTTGELSGSFAHETCS